MSMKERPDVDSLSDYYEQAMMISIGGIVVVMLMLVEEIGELLETIQTVFGL